MNADTDAAADWTVRAFATPGGPNDGNCSTDADGDGIPDCAELPGTTFAGLPYYDWGARQGQKDIFIELDYMTSADPGITPRKEALDKVVAAFAARGYAVHFDTGTLYSATIDPASYNLGGGNALTFAPGLSLVAGTGITSLYQYKAANFDVRRRPVFHYLIFGNSQLASGAAGSSGLAELNGNDFLVTLGGWGLTASTTAALNELI
ncbi:MAG TPA: hypothetical protein VMH77_09040, partial [Steroidobacteraceae bacterium]|nr:hypothetical protein [Steroidobacteraceae bacterium]